MMIELVEDTASRLKEAAAEAGVDMSTLVERLLILDRNRQDPAIIQRRSEAIDQWLEQLKSSTATSGRDGRPWREFIHEGHKY